MTLLRKSGPHPKRERRGNSGSTTGAASVYEISKRQKSRCKVAGITGSSATGRGPACTRLNALARHVAPRRVRIFSTVWYGRWGRAGCVVFPDA